MSHNEAGKAPAEAPELKDHIQNLHLTEFTSDKAPAPEVITVPKAVPVDDDYAVEPTKEDIEFALFCMIRI